MRVMPTAAMPTMATERPMLRKFSTERK